MKECVCLHDISELGVRKDDKMLYIIRKGYSFSDEEYHIYFINSVDFDTRPSIVLNTENFVYLFRDIIEHREGLINELLNNI